jgi:hypothetical protein
MGRVRSTIAVDELRPIAAEELPDLPIDEPRASTSFLATAIEFAIGWFRAHDQCGSQNGGAAILVAAEYPRRDTTGLRVEASTLLRQDFIGDHYGRVFVCNDAITVALELCEAPRNALGAGRFIQAKGFGRMPTVVLLPAGRSITMYWHGLDDEAAVWELHVPPTAPEALTQSQLSDVLDAIWDNALASPQPGYDVVWKRHDDYIAFGQAERLVQNLVVQMLRVEFRENFLVRPEDRQVSGRIDISISPRKHGVIGVGTIELKALCSRRESTQPAGYRSEGASVHAKAITKGLGQAIDAKGRLDADIALLACYDLRKLPKEATAFAKAVVTKARRMGIVLRHYPLYPSAEARRNAEQAPRRRSADASLPQHRPR